MIKFLDLHKINQPYRQAFERCFQTFLDSGQYILGDEVSDFETQFASFCGTRHCIGVANGLDALVLILRAHIELGYLKKGDAVLVPANTYIASILGVINSGLKPVFVEPQLDTFNISVQAMQSAMTPDVKGVMVVHLYGQLAEMDAILTFAKNNNLLVFEDAAQAHGALDSKGRKAGNFGAGAGFSFYPSKNLGAFGDAGAVTTNDDQIARCVKTLRNYGSSKKYINPLLGINSRLDELQAIFLNLKLKHLDSDNTNRRHLAKRYLCEITNPKVKLPFYDGTKNHVFHLFVVLVDNREAFMSHLKSKGVETMIHYPVAPHHQEALKMYSHLHLPITSRIHSEAVSLPISPVLTDEELNIIIDHINSY
jgi:dTDP-4-amino-4,6-dideoxygalactose transaminase